MLFTFSTYFNLSKYVEQYYQTKSIFSLLNVISKNLMRRCEKKGFTIRLPNVSRTCSKLLKKLLFSNDVSYFEGFWPYRLDDSALFLVNLQFTNNQLQLRHAFFVTCAKTVIHTVLKLKVYNPWTS